MKTLRLTPEILKGAYEFLRTTPPFRRWGLPEADAVSFRITRHPDCYGQCWTKDDMVGIDISEQKVGHTLTLLATMAHEMIHLWQIRAGAPLNHNAEFKRRAAVVCSYHGFDPNAF